MSREHLDNPRVQDAQRDLDRRPAAQWGVDLERILATYEGRRFCYRLVEEVCGLHEESFGPAEMAIKSGDAAHARVDRNEGIRAVGLWLWRIAERECPDRWRQAVDEGLRATEAARALREQVTRAAASSASDGE
jgi:hypothetical protein